MSEPWVEDSIERTTGRVAWGYALLFAIAYHALFAPPSSAPVVDVVAYLAGLMVVYGLIIQLAAARSNPLAWMLGRFPRRSP